MRFALPVFLLLALTAAASSFSIDSYHARAAVRDDGGLDIHENISFTLEEAYEEGFRTIRFEDFGTLDNIIVHYAKVNGEDAQFVTQLDSEGRAEIVWKKTYAGKNNVELSYTLKDRAQLYNDFAKVCFEHYGGGWSVPAAEFVSVMSLPEASRGKDMHFEVYSTKEGNARIDDLSIVIEMIDVPPGNYIGGCYLYDRDALHTTNTVDAPALAILNDEREAYGSKMLLEPETTPSTLFCCLPAAAICGLAAAYFFIKDRRKPKYPENILPPDGEEPAFVSVLIRNRMPASDIMAAAILSLIIRDHIDIVELEKKGESSTQVKRGHTILFLKKRPENPKPYEAAVLDMIFPQGKTEADLDAMAAGYGRINAKGEAEKIPAAAAVETFTSEIGKVLAEKKISDLKDAADTGDSALVGISFMGLIFGCYAAFFSLDFIAGYLLEGNLAEAYGLIAAILIAVPSAVFLAMRMRRIQVHEDQREEYERWDAFARAVKLSRLKEYPPSSAVIWGGILVYATALGMADKVRNHLSELDALTAKRVETLGAAGVSSRQYFASAWALHNLKTYGSRSGASGGSRGGFSSHSSGGWSSGGGGGFSSHSSGGGGFR
ncbi:DUF2207 domain-containing protein [Candidatus Micrarchaeota archaeon]|nr:DUF2207 domain-containing protein [Candidatus Micrarchaeota archaeon]